MFETNGLRFPWTALRVFDRLSCRSAISLSVHVDAIVGGRGEGGSIDKSKKYESEDSDSEEKIGIRDMEFPPKSCWETRSGKEVRRTRWSHGRQGIDSSVSTVSSETLIISKAPPFRRCA